MRDAHARTAPRSPTSSAGPRSTRASACHGIDIPFTFGNFGDGWAEFVGSTTRARLGRRAIRWAAFTPKGSRLAAGTRHDAVRSRNRGRRSAARRRSLTCTSSGTTSSSHSSIARADDRARARHRRTARPARHSARLRRGARSSRRATDPCRSRAGLALPVPEIRLHRARSRPVWRDSIRAANSAAVSASGPVSRSAPTGGSEAASTAAATSAMSRGSIHAIRPSPVGNTMRPRGSAS